MSPGLKLRLGAFVVAIGLMISLGAWTANTFGKRIHEMRQRLTVAQSESFQFADRVQHSVLTMNNLVFRYQIHHDRALWEEVRQARDELNRQVTNQVPVWTTSPEKGLLARLGESYGEYVEAARSIKGPDAPAEQPAASLARSANFEAKSEGLLNLVYQLADAHRRSLNSFLHDSDRSLAHLQYVLWTSLGLLLVCGAGLAVIVYREMIAPLRVKLVESRALVERQEKLASLGLLAAGVAHEIRNPLTAMKAHLYALTRLLDPDAPEQSDAQVIGQEVNRLERIVSDFLLFARPAEPNLERVPADQPIQEMETLMAAPLAAAGIRLTVEPSPPAWIRIDRRQLKQVLVNLIQNAAESVSRGGAIVLRARLDRRRLQERMTNVVVLEVQDNGPGIPLEAQQRLFDPFFTTKESGTGLGLSIALRLVSGQGGQLQYQTQPGRGTTFGVVLPEAT